MKAPVRHHVTVVGEALIDLVPSGDPLTFEAKVGGSPLNVAVGLARLGMRTSLMARLGDNAFGRVLRRYLESESVDLAASVRAPEPTTLAVVSLDQAGNAAYDFYTDGTADWQWSREELDLVPPDTTIVHFGSISAWTDPGWLNIVDLVEELHGGGEVLVSYDPNVRPKLCGSRDQATSRIERAVSSSHLVKVSAEDLAWLYPEVAPAAVAQGWIKLGAGLVVVTNGASGASAYRRDGIAVTRPAASVNIVDTVGAGDSFSAALLAALCEAAYASPDSIALIESEALDQALGYAVIASSITCSRSGANPPTSAEMTIALGPASENMSI